MAACGDRPRGDAGWYWHALSVASTFEQAMDDCEHIDGPDSAGDCQLATLERYDKVDGDHCSALEGQSWREACLFQYSRALAEAGDQESALEVCEELRVARWCTYRQLSLVVEASMDDTPVVAEARIADFAQLPSLGDAPQQFWIQRFRAIVKAGLPLDPRDCDALKSPRPCESAVNQAVRRQLDTLARQDLALACAVGVGSSPFPGKVPWVESEPLRSSLAAWATNHCSGDKRPAPPSPGISP